MTLRAILLGFVGAAIICGATYFNDAVMHQTYLVGNNMPISVYGVLILVIVLFNPLLYIIWKRLALNGRELAVILVLTLAACCIPGSGLMRTFTCGLVTPYKHEQNSPAWQKPVKEKYWRKDSMLKQVPPYMLVDVTKQTENDVVNAFNSGKSKGTSHITLDQVPWNAWKRSLGFWIPLLLIFWVGLLGLGIVVHKQWADHEQLPYPIATFANTLLPGAKEAVAEVVRNRLFWIGMMTVMLLYLNNYACKYFPNLIPLPTFLDFTALNPLIPKISAAGGWIVTQPRIYYTVIAFAYFLATDVSLALGIGPVLWFLVSGTMLSYGISLKGTSPGADNFLSFGAYLGMMLVLLYTGRRYYMDVLRAALFIHTPTKPNANSVWGARIFMVAMIALIFYMSVLGKMHWQITVLFVGLSVLMFVVMTRVVAETGIFFVQSNFIPTAILLGVFGPGGLGPQTVLLLTMFAAVLLIDPREAVMPFMVNSFKLCDLQNIHIGKISSLAVIALVLGFAVAIPATLYFQYDRGANATDAWASKIVPSMPFDQATQVEQRLEAQGQLQTASALTGWGHFAHMAPDPKMLIALAVGLGLVLLFTVGRLRFSKWPVHPVMFLIWTTYPAMWFFGSFLFGWLVKSLVVRYGGGTLYRNLKPLMIGLIAGEMVGGALTIIIGMLYFFLTKQNPQGFSIMPG